MKVELTPDMVKPFHLIHPATTFCPVFDHGKNPKRPDNVFLKLNTPNTDQAVNLKTGDLMRISRDALCHPVDMKVSEDE